MFVHVNRTKIDRDPKYQVTSHLIFEPHRRQSSDDLKFHNEGIFSKKIFGNLWKCNCGRLNEPGFCKKCGTTVIDIKNIPEFWIDLTINVAVPFADWDNCGINPEEAQQIMLYKYFLYEGQVFHFDPEMDSISFDEAKIKIGYEALKEMGVSDEWLKENLTNSLSVPHTMYRPMVIDGRNLPYVTGINQLYSNIIKSINDTIEMHEYAKLRPFYLMIEYSKIVELYNNIIESLFDELQNIKYSIIKSEIISHPISGAIRAVLINRHDVHEDVLIIGDTLVETLWPYLYKKHAGNMVEINKELVERNLLVLINRPPTISHLSIMAMKPRIASVYPIGHTEETDRCLKHNEKYVEEHGDKIGRFSDQDGDIEKFSKESVKDGVDTLGLRCVGMNPITMDGLAADTDGDCLLVISLYSNAANKEAESILPSRTYMNYANGTIRNHIIEDFIFALDEE